MHKKGDFYMQESLQKKVERMNLLLKEEDFQINHTKVFKNNQMLDGLFLGKKHSNLSCSPIVYVDDEIRKKSDDELMNYLKDFYLKHSLNIDDLPSLSKEYILSNVLPCLYSNTNSTWMSEKDIAFLPFLDMDISFFLPIDMNTGGEDCNTNLRITNSILATADLDMEVVLEASKANAKKRVQIQRMSDIINDICGTEMNPDLNHVDLQMFVINYKTESFGAGAMINEKILKCLETIIGSSFVILPSSVHEFICLPLVRQETDLKFLFDMVTEINDTKVDLQDRLTDNIYIWENDSLTKYFNI